jgi:3',5'-cyclic AMP phosphodiesterase CpdA
MKMLHFSDVHVQVDYREIGYHKLCWRRLLAQLELGRYSQYAQAPRVIDLIGGAAAWHQVDHVVLSGDITGLAYDAEFAGARKALGQLARPELLTVIPGNHDRFTPESDREKTFERHFGDLLVSDLPEYAAEGPYPFVRLVGDDTAVVGLSSARVPAFPGLAYGVLGKLQLDALSALLDDPRIKDRFVFVTVHHCPMRRWAGWDFPGHGMVDAKRLLQVVRGERRAILSGHIHERYWLQAEGDRPHLFCAGSSTCTGEEGYWLIDVQDGLIAGAQKHELVSRLPAETSARPVPVLP